MKLFSVFFLILMTSTFAQSHRSLINDGVDLYKKGKFADAEVNFKKGLEKKPDLFQGHFNLGDSYYKQGRYDEAIQSYKNALSFTEDKLNKAKVFHNIGNALLKSQKYQESIEAYKNALKLNPDDVETKYNLSYALNMLKQKQDQNQKNQNNNQNKQNDDKKNNQDKNNQDKKNQQDREQNKQNQQQQQKNQITKEDAQRILEALKNNEQDLQKRLRKIKGRAVVVDKDW